MKRGELEVRGWPCDHHVLKRVRICLKDCELTRVNDCQLKRVGLVWLTNNAVGKGNGIDTVVLAQQTGAERDCSSSGGVQSQRQPGCRW